MKKVFTLFLLLIFQTPLTQASIGVANAYAKNAKEAILMDADTGTVLYEKNPDQITYPSSMTKIMTTYPALQRIKDGRLSLDDKFKTSVKAWKTGGTRTFLEPNKYVKVADLLRGIIIQSGNDASVVLAENLGGTEEDYAKEMTKLAESIGAKNSSFKNAHGLTEPGHYSTVRDLAIITASIIHNFPDLYKIFKEQVFTYNGIKQYNRNPLLKIPGLGATGTKTGHTDEGGYGLVGSATKDGRTLIVVVNGLPSEKKRAEAAERLLNWGFREFDNYNLIDPSKPIMAANVWLGKKASVPLMASGSIKVTLPKASRHDIKVEAIYSSPLPAPIKEGQLVGRLEITAPHTPTITLPLLAGADIEEVGIFGRLLSALNYIIWGHG